MKILAVSKFVFDKYLKDKGVTSENVESQKNIVFISINNTTPQSKADVPYFDPTKEYKNVKIMYFDDVNEDVYVPLLDGSKKQIKATAFTETQAASLYSFIKNTIKEQKTESVIVHCTAGVSRSGAVASFIHDFVSGKWEYFKKDNPNIQPNHHVYKLLHNQWYKDLEYPSQTVVLRDQTITIQKNPNFDI